MEKGKRILFYHEKGHSVICNSNLVDTVLSEINKAQKDKYYMISLRYKFERVKLIEVEDRMVLPGTAGGGSNASLRVQSFS
jgi:hypothetical protein